MNARTYNNALIDEKARAVYYKSISEAEKMIDGTATMNVERLHALAALADAAASGFDPDSEEDRYRGE